jgi:hypothetical protein
MQALEIPSALTVLCTTQNGREKWEAESELYSTVSFSAPSNIASSKSMAEIQTQNKPQYDIQNLTQYTKRVNFQLERKHYPLGHERVSLVSVSWKQRQPHPHSVCSTVEPQCLRQVRLVSSALQRHPHTFYTRGQNSRSTLRIGRFSNFSEYSKPNYYQSGAATFCIRRGTNLLD